MNFSKLTLGLLPIALLLIFLVSNYSISQNYKWEQITGFPGLGRDDAVAFAIGNDIYIGSGNHGGFSQSNRFFSYNIITKAWKEVAPFPGPARQYARAEIINGKAYVLLGIDLYNNPLNDLWEYDPETDNWRNLANFPGEKRWQAISFIIEGELYCGTGRDWTIIYNDFWKYNPLCNSWTELSDMPGIPRYEAVAFSAFGAGYVGLGRDCTGVYLNDFWQYNPQNNAWEEKTQFPGGKWYYSKAETVNGIGFVFTGENEIGEMKSDIWSYNTKSDSWSDLGDLPGEARRGVASCAIPSKGIYVACGLSASFDRLTEIHAYVLEENMYSDMSVCYSRLTKEVYISNLTIGDVLMLVSINGAVLGEYTVNSDHLLIDLSEFAIGTYIVINEVNLQSTKIINY